MTCNLTSLININDGTTSLDIDGFATLSGRVSRGDTGTGHGETEYADGSAKRWIRFERHFWTISGIGPAPAGLWVLDLTVATWSATFPNPDNPGNTITVTVVPNRPSNYGQNIGRIQRSWALELREAQAQ